MLLRSWNLMRVLRLLIGVWAIIEGLQTKEMILGLMGGVLLVMAVVNIGCCGVSGCRTPMTTKKNTSQKTKQVSYEEITHK